MTRERRGFIQVEALTPEILYVETGNENKLLKTCILNSENRKCTVDLGSECSIIRESIARKLDLKFKGTNKMLRGFNHAMVDPIAKSKLKICIDNIPFEIKVFIVRDNDLSKEILVGRNILLKSGTKAITDMSGVTFTLDNPNEVNNIVDVQMIDMKQEKLVKEADIHCGNLDEKSKDRLIKLLNKYRSTVSFNIKELGKTDAAEMKIELKTETPVFHEPYRLSHSDRNKVKEIIQELEKNGIIRESNSSFASPIILISKKNGESRLVIDYRALNKITKRIQYPLPLIDDHIDLLNNKKVFTSLDLKSGFYQIPMHPDSIEKTAFITPDGQWEFLRMPFGLANAPATFQKAINKILKNSALVYIDDVLIPTESSEDGFEQLEKVLQALQTNGLTLNLTKCRFFQEQIEYLGREITGEGVSPGSSKIMAVMKVEDPINVKQVRQFLGLAGYFRKFIKNFAQIVLPLTILLRKNITFVCGEEQKEAVQTIKKILSKRPILAIYDTTLETEVHTDASAIGLGAILIQYHANGKRVVAYYSRKTTPEE